MNDSMTRTVFFCLELKQIHTVLIIMVIITITLLFNEVHACIYKSRNKTVGKQFVFDGRRLKFSGDSDITRVLVTSRRRQI
jgi:hypothetical protein